MAEHPAAVTLGINRLRDSPDAPTFLVLSSLEAGAIWTLRNRAFRDGRFSESGLRGRTVVGAGSHPYCVAPWCRALTERADPHHQARRGRRGAWVPVALAGAAVRVRSPSEHCPVRRRQAAAPDTAHLYPHATWKATFASDTDFPRGNLIARGGVFYRAGDGSHPVRQRPAVAAMAGQAARFRRSGSAIVAQRRLAVRRVHEGSLARPTSAVDCCGRRHSPEPGLPLEAKTAPGGLGLCPHVGRLRGLPGQVHGDDFTDGVALVQYRPGWRRC